MIIKVSSKCFRNEIGSEKNGWDNYSLFMRKDGLMFGYLEAKIHLQILEGMSTEEVK